MSKFVTQSFVCGKCSNGVGDKKCPYPVVWCRVKKERFNPNKPFCSSFISSNLLANVGTVNLPLSRIQ